MFARLIFPQTSPGFATFNVSPRITGSRSIQGSAHTGKYNYLPNHSNFWRTGLLIALPLMLLFCSSVARCNTYSTSFPLTENPISENGTWINGGVVGLSWNNCQTANGYAFGTQTGLIDYNDSICTVNGSWGPDQTAQLTIRVTSTSNAEFEEAEVHLRTTISLLSITGYEINCSVQPAGSSAGPYMQIVRWNGLLGNFTELNGTSSVGCADGDVLKASISGSTIAVYKNGTQVLTSNDSTYTSGQPGMGFYIQNLLGSASGANSEFGASYFTATDGLANTPATTPEALTCTPTSLVSGASGNCTVTLNQAAPAGGASVAVSSTNAALTAPGSVTIPAGSTSATFGTTAGSFSSTQTATITASLSGVSQSATINLEATQSLASAGTAQYVQGNYATPQNPQSAVSVTFNAAQVAGDLNVVVVGWNDSTAVVSSVTDQVGNSYQLAVGPAVQSGYSSQSIYYAANIASAAGGTNTVTVTFTVAARYPDIRILEYSGLDPTNPVDVTASNLGNSSTSIASVTTTNPNDLLVASNLVQTVSTGIGSGFTQRLLTQDGDIAGDEVVTSAGSYSASSPLSPSAPWIMQLVAFRTAPGSGTTAYAVDLSWDAPSSSTDPVAGYNVYRALSGTTAYQQLNSYADTQVAFEDSTVQAGLTYDYMVESVDASGVESVPSNIAVVAIP
jgi:hypothetical protein